MGRLKATRGLNGSLTGRHRETSSGAKEVEVAGISYDAGVLTHWTEWQAARPSDEIWIKAIGI